MKTPEPAARRPLPRVALALLGLVHAAVLGGAAAALPWRAWTAFSILAGGLAAAFLLLAVAAAVVPSRLAGVFRAVGVLALTFLVWATWELASAGLYLVKLYDGVGAGLAGAAAAAWCVIALFTLPLGAWGLVATGGVGFRVRRGASPAPVAIAVAALGFVFLLALRASAARGEDRLLGLAPSDGLDLALRRALRTEAERGGGAPLAAPAPRTGSLFVTEAIACLVPPSEADHTILAVARLGDAAPVRLCAQGRTLDDASATLVARLAEVGDLRRVTAAIDVVREVAPLPERGPLLGAVSLRPGLDGVCAGGRCLPPWLAVARQQFTTMASFPSIQLELGATATALRTSLGLPPGDAFAGLDRFASVQLLLREGRLLPLERGRLAERPAVDADTVEGRTRDALRFVIAAQEKDGRFRYLVDPHTGATSFANFSVPRQAGTTLAVCEMAGLDRKAVGAARKSLAMLAGLERRDGDRGGIVWPKGSTKWMPLGNTALSMIAFLGCRDRTGKTHDALIHRMGQLLLATQRPSGSFAPAFDPATGPRGEGDPMYAEGQVVMALVLWEAMLLDVNERPAGTPDEGTLRTAIDRAMAHFAGPYWDLVVRDFFFFEENWHCLAARAALAHHRRDDYERFCLDYVAMKTRLVHDPASGGEADLVGAYGFGTVFPPHNTATAGYGEALAAAIAVARARGLDTTAQEARMRDVLGYLMQQQWTDATCFACSDAMPMVGSFSEHYGEPTIRIDYVQHAMAALGHGGQALGLLPAVRAAGVPRAD